MCENVFDPNINAELEKIRGALAMYGDYRTIGGIARDARLPVECVERILEANQGVFEESPLRIGGERVFGLRCQGCLEPA